MLVYEVIRSFTGCRIRCEGMLGSRTVFMGKIDEYSYFSPGGVLWVTGEFYLYSVYFLSLPLLTSNI